MRAGTSLILLACAAAPAAGQGVLNSFSYEGVRVAAFGVEVGGLTADRLERDVTVSVRMDGGYIAPHIRPLLGVSWFHSRYTADQITEFENRLRAVVIDPTADFSIDVGAIALTDLALEGDLQFIGTGRLRPYAGLGAGIHLRNATGAAIQGTFVEDALETVAATLNGSAGLEWEFTHGVRFSVDVRGMYGSGIAAATARAGLWLLVPGGRS